MEQMNLQISQILQPTLNVQIVQNNAPVVEAKIVIGGGGTVSVVFGDTMTGTGTPSDPVNVSNDILEQIQNNSETAEENASQITEIQRVIPATANSQNQLADQGFVNSSIQTATAYFRGDWATWADVPSDPSLYPVDATGNRTPTTNDYMVVIADEQENGGTWRYKYTGLWSEQGKDGWQPEYQVNETPLTAAQLAALNSGITADAVASFVKNTDYATSSTGGVIKTSLGYGNKLDNSGILHGVDRNLEDYNNSGDWLFISKGTLENIKYDYVKRGITGNTIALTDEEKTAAQTWLGIDSAGGASLPDQTGNAGKFLMTNGTEVSWGEALVNKATGFASLQILGTPDIQVSQAFSVAIGYNSNAQARYCTVLGYAARAKANYAVQIGDGENADANTFKVGNANGNFEMMSADGTIPAERMSATAGTTGQVLTKTDTGMAWQDASGGGGDCLPLSGGTLTGPLQIQNALLSQTEFNRFGIGPDYAPDLFVFALGGGHFYPKWNSGKLGTSLNKWGNVYTLKLNNGADIAVPTTGGTMARIEDIDAAVGDISTALTAILGE